MSTQGTLSDAEHMTLFRALRVYALTCGQYDSFLNFLIDEERETVPLYLQDLLTSDLHEEKGIEELNTVMMIISMGDTGLGQYLPKLRKLTSPRFQTRIDDMFEIYDTDLVPVMEKLNTHASRTGPEFVELQILRDIIESKMYDVSRGTA